MPAAITNKSATSLKDDSMGISLSYIAVTRAFWQACAVPYLAFGAVVIV
jgi:hypothetical protein